MYHKLKRVNVFGNTEYVCNTLPNMVVVEDNHKFHIMMNDRIPDWDTGFDTSKDVETFINEHEMDTATLSQIYPKEIIEAFNFLKVFYGFTQVDEDLIEKEVDSSLISILKILDRVEVTFDDRLELFTDGEELVKFIDEITNSLHCEVLSSEDIKYAMSSRTTVLASISSRELTKNMVRVRSSNVWAYCINIKDRKDKEGDVLVQFKGPKGGAGDIYIYYGVPLNIWRKILASPSKGHAVWQYLRGKYTYAKLTGDRKTKMRGGIN